VNANVETAEQFALRRIRWATEYFVARQHRANRSGIARATGLGAGSYSLPGVQEAISIAKMQIELRLDNILAVRPATA